MILMYHKVHPDSPTMWWVSVNDFYRQMSELSFKQVVFLEDYDPFNKDQVVITFDGIYKNIIEYALPILEHFNYPFELFLTSNYVGKDNEFDSVEPNAPFANEEELKELVQRGGRLQWHTRSHLNLKEIFDLDVIHQELTIPENIFALDPKGFNWFAYPHGEYNAVVKEEVKRKFGGAVSCNQGNNRDKYILNRVTVVNTTSLREQRIACIIASYNYGSYLIEAIESVLKQTILPNEILISDDCSDDETQEIGEFYSRTYPSLISYNRNPKNLGVVDHFNKALSLTSSEYVFFLGADNKILSNYVEETAKVLDSDKKTAIAYTDYAFFGPRARLKYERFQNDRKGGIIDEIYYQIKFPEFENKSDLLEELERGNFIQGSSMFKREAFEDVGGYIKTNLPEDYNLFVRIIKNGWNAKKARKTNLEYRQHSLGQANDVLSIQNRMLFYKNALKSQQVHFAKLLEKKNAFESSKFYKINFFTFKAIYFFKKNYKTPRKILKRIYNVLSNNKR